MQVGGACEGRKRGRKRVVMEDDKIDLSRFFCQNPRCVAYGSKEAGNLTLCGYTDKAKCIRQLYCRTCKKRFSIRKGTVFYRAHMPPEQVVDILRHVQDGNGMRQTGRLTGHKEDTVIHYAKRAGQHARLLHEQLVAFSPQHPRGAMR
jgi:transposase-like protein